MQDIIAAFLFALQANFWNLMLKKLNARILMLYHGQLGLSNSTETLHLAGVDATHRHAIDLRTV